MTTKNGDLYAPITSPPAGHVISLPYQWEPRPYQIPAWTYLTSPSEHPKRAFFCWHRRSGKDTVCLHYMAVKAMEKTGTYWYMGPTTTQAREAFWDAVGEFTGIRRIYEAFIGPHDPQRGLYGLIANKNENEMTIDLVNGSRIRFCGSDNFVNLLGSPPIGLVFSEYARADPMAWNLLRPILRFNKGFAIFNTTPVGMNHAHDLYRLAENRPNWFASRIPISATNLLSQPELDAELEEYIAGNGEDAGRALFDQEYHVSWSGGMVGAYWARELEKAEQENRLTKIPYDPRVPVHTAWDLGFTDSTAIWFIQLVGHETRIIDYLEHSNVGLDWYAKQLKEKGYVFGSHILPHDAAVKELGSGRSRVETLRSLGINPRVVPAQSIMDGINAVRTLIPSCWFDKEKCKKGLDALRQYRRKWDDKRKCYADSPYHDWTSHAADALRYYAMANVRNVVSRPMTYKRQGFV